MATSPLHAGFFTKLCGPESVWFWENLEEGGDHDQNTLHDIFKR